MATVNGNALLGGVGLEVPQGSQVEIVQRVDEGFSSFSVRWHTPGGPVTGTITTNLLTFTAAEIDEHEIPTDANGLPLFRNLRVRYVGQSNPAVTNGDFLIVEDLWHHGEAMECRCIHHGNARPNTNGRVVVPRNSLERA